MAISSVEVNNFLVFRGAFSVDFCPGVNVIIGGNGTGKTTMMKIMYFNTESRIITAGQTDEIYAELYITNDDSVEVYFQGKLDGLDYKFCSTPEEGYQAVYIPEKDMLSNAKGLPETWEYGDSDFSQIDIDIIKKARILAKKPKQALYLKICNLIGGEPKSEGESFFMKRDDLKTPIHFSHEASGYRKLGLLALLIRNEQIKPGSVLFWDEPENSLNPEIVPVLVGILLELAQNGVQIFVTTHDYNLARYFDVRKNKDIPVMFHNFSKDDKGYISCVSSVEYIKISHNLLESSSADLFKAVVADALEVDDDE